MKKALLLLIVLSSCAPVYIPNSRNSPMFQKGGEFQGSVSFGNGIEAQTALSITNHFGVMGNFLYIDRVEGSDTDNDEDNFRHHKFFEGGIGYFENQEKMFVEIFAGYGRGEGSSSDEFITGSTAVKATESMNVTSFSPLSVLTKKPCIYRSSPVFQWLTLRSSLMVNLFRKTALIHVRNNFQRILIVDLL
jgi:hypothetical protein